MLVTSARTVALRCPLCGRFGIHSFTVFNFSGGKPFKLVCDCGFNKMTISTGNYKEYNLQIPCVICETAHHIKLTHNELWETRLQALDCPERSLSLGFLGRENEVATAIETNRDNTQSIVNDDGFDDFFAAPDIMYQILSRLHAVSQRGDLFCTCGQNDIEVEVFSDRLELRCPSCRSINFIFAETAEDLQAVIDAPVIELVEGGFTSIDASEYRRKIRAEKTDRIDRR